MLRVYVAGPYRQGNQAANVACAIRAASQLALRGFAPFVPHPVQFFVNCLEKDFPMRDTLWLEVDTEWVRQSDVVLRLPGPSEGADIEVQAAREANIPVFETIPQLLSWARQRGKF